MGLIKRYSNRKLYDTVAKSYITLENIENMVKNGEKVQIIENETGEEITAAVLSQIIADRTRKHKDYSPSVFVQMIRKGGGTMYDYARKIVQTVGETVYSVEEEVETKIKRMVSSGEITSEEGSQLSKDLQKQRAAYLKKAESQLESILVSVLGKLSIPSKAEIERLNKTIDLLEKRIDELELPKNEKVCSGENDDQTA